jgi:hypothetical protein
MLLSMYGSGGDVEPRVGLAVQLGALGTQVRVCRPEGCDARLATGAMPTGGWR